jgi:hypothetical protein
LTVAAFQDAAREYAAAGIVPLPIAPNGKRPLVNHPGKFGRRAALQIAPKFPDANLGFWCGRHNGLTVVDIDSSTDAELQHALSTYGDSPIIVQTASGKHHAYYHHNGERRRIRPDKSHPIDILGEGGLCVAPPSTRSGGRYEFVRGGLANLANLPTIRRGALENLEPAPVEKVDGSVGAAPIGRRNDSLFRLALAMAHDAESLADLLERASRANAELSRPPLPAAEVRRAAASAWRYKLDGRLMTTGMNSSILLPSASIARLLTAGETDAMALLALLRKAHSGQIGRTFAVSPLALERARKIGSWDKRRYRNAARRLRDLGELVQVKPGGRGPHDPATYRFAPPKKGDGFAPQS